MITPSFSLTATERVLPKLALDFTTAVLDPRVTFTRTTDATHPATYVNNTGYVTAATNNQPRFDYDSVTLTCKGLLIEESRSNLFQYTEDYSNAFWNKGNVTITTNATLAPDNTMTADAVFETVTNGAHSVYENTVNIVAGTLYSVSWFVAPNGRDRLAIAGSSGLGGGLGSGVFFDLTGSGSVIGTPSGTATIKKYANGFFRITYSWTASGTNTYILGLYLVNTGTNTSYAGDITKGIYVWGADLEVGAFPTSYIPRLDATVVTRNADVATMTGTNFSDWFNASEGTFVLYSQTPLNATYAEYMAASNGAYSNCITLGYQSSAGRLLGQMYAGGSNILYANPNGAGAGALNKQSITYKNGNSIYATNGGVRQTSVSSSIPSGMDRLNIGRDASGGSSANGWVAKIFYYNINFTSAQMQAFTQ